ncbi:hypothetical protein RN001_009983 [Aquatica leii]|uniref:Uncharacterized protein n=1 Tax=Aquatica leii TaxID=1421715 RepID=A0AAN7PVX2_9COLE|nr:hypothetical protein RN001_009983 [Aquatica leii]
MRHETWEEIGRELKIPENVTSTTTVNENHIFPIASIPDSSGFISNNNITSSKLHTDESLILKHKNASGSSSKINILSEVIIQRPHSALNLSLHTCNSTSNQVDQNVPVDELVSKGPNISSTFSKNFQNYDTWCESVTSESEYVPSDDKKQKKVYKKSTNHLSKRDLTQLLPEEEQTKSTHIPENTEITGIIKKQRINVFVNKTTNAITSDSTEFPTSTTENYEPIPKKHRDSYIDISAAVKHEGKRIRNKGHACYFCQKRVQNSSRHFEVMHGKETEVIKILVMPKNSKQRRDNFANLIRVGDFYHNSEVISMKKGELILVRRPTVAESKLVTLNDYGPCPHCLGFMLKKHLWHHIRDSCTAKKDNNVDQSRQIIAESNAILNNTFGTELSTDFITNIFSKLRDDDVGNYCREDNLILRFGAMLFEKHGTTQCELTRQSMRQLSRFTLTLRKMENSKLCLSDYLVPQKFDVIIQATKLLCVSHKNIVRRPEFEIPSLALKIGYALRKCAAIQRGKCLRAGNLRQNETLMCFLNLMDLEWSTRISSNALVTLYNRKINATQLLPLTSDLIKLNQHIQKEMSKAHEMLLKCTSIQNWTKLASLCLGKIILFNKRRSGEASRMTTSEYSSRPLWSEQLDKGEVNKFAGKKLEDINLEDIPNVEESEDDAENEAESVENMEFDGKDEQNRRKVQLNEVENVTLLSPHPYPVKVVRKDHGQGLRRLKKSYKRSNLESGTEDESESQAFQRKKISNTTHTFLQSTTTLSLWISSLHRETENGAKAVFDSTTEPKESFEEKPYKKVVLYNQSIFRPLDKCEANLKPPASENNIYSSC